MEEVNGELRLNIGDSKWRDIHKDEDHPRGTKDIIHQASLINSLSCWEMDSLTAFCDTLLPCITTLPPETTSQPNHDHLFTFYTNSASMAGTPLHLGGFMSERLKHPALILLRLALWVLSTKIGALILCGRLSMSTHFPYLQSFSEVCIEKREKILLSWSSSYFYLLRMLFYAIKSLALFIFFTQVNEKNDNLSWKALGYCGPDPDFVTQIQKPLNPGGRGEEKEEEDEVIGPLFRGLVDPTVPKQILAHTLKRSGFSVSIENPPKASPNNKSSKLTIHCDAVIVGSGSGGGVAAGILAMAGYKVIVLEKGNYYARKSLSLLEGPTMDQMYQGSGFVATKDLSVAILAASTVGGGATINWSASIKTPQHVLKEWCSCYELELFQSQLYKKAMQVVCDRMGVQSGICNENLNNAVLRRGCLELGYPVNDIPRNSPPDHYCGWCCLGCKDGQKKGTTETWLIDMVNSGNGVILTGCEVKKIMHERKKQRSRSTATGVSFEFVNGKEKEVYFVQSKVTIVAGGAFGTPILLKRSGLKNENIGKHLHLHPVVMSWGYFPNAKNSSAWPEEYKKSYEGGIMTAMSTVVGEFSRSGYGAVIQTPALHPGLFSAVMPWVSGADMKERMSRFSRTAHLFALARDKGSGEVTSFSSVGYNMDESDEENLKRGLEKTLRILAAAGAEEIGTHHFTGKKLNVKRASEHEFERFVKEECARGIKGLSTPLCSAHQMGSCRMGMDPKTSVVNQSGETWEVEGLFLADSSVFPTALGVNPMVTIQSIAYCTAQSVIEVLRRKKSYSEF